MATEPAPSATDTGRGRRARLLRDALRAADSYALLLFLLLCDVVVMLLSPESGWGAFIQVPFVAATLLLAMHTSRAQARTMRIARIAAALATVLAAVRIAAGGPAYAGLSHLMLSGLLVAAAIAIIHRIATHPVVSTETILGAVCVYVMLGLLFAFMFMAINGLGATPFLAQGPSKDPADYLYLSFITVTTTGYGDLTPASGIPRVACVLEALLGQIFLVTSVARLVSLYGREKGPVGAEAEERRKALEKGGAEGSPARGGEQSP